MTPMGRSAAIATTAAPARIKLQMICLILLSGNRPAKGLSDLESAKVGNAVLHQVQVHFDEVILDSTRLRRRKDLLPVQGVLAHRHDLPGTRSPALHMHRDETAGVLHEVF